MSPPVTNTDDEKTGWWSRPCGGREVLALSPPLVISTASSTAMHFIDRMFLMWQSPAAMAASMPAGMLHFTLLCFPLGVASYVNTFVAQYYGAGRPNEIGRVVRHGMRLGLYVGPLFLATIPLAPLVFSWAGHGELAPLESLYFQVLAFGAGGTIIAAAQAAFFTGRGATRTVMVVDVGAALLNIVLDYALIFGHWGFAALGIEGAGWATVTAQWAKVFAYGLLMRRRGYAQYGLHGASRIDLVLVRRILRFGGPNGLQMLVEMSAFTLFIMLVGSLGPAEAAASTLAFSVNTMAFVPLIGVGVAVSTLVGQQQGRGNADLAARATWTALVMSVAYTLVFAALYLSVPELFLMGHAAGSSHEQFEEIAGLTLTLLRFVAAYCFFDALAIIFTGAIKGAGDTRFVLIVTAVFSPLPLLVGWLGVRWAGLGLYWCWWVITGWIAVLGLIYLARFLQGRWRAMLVIESDPPTAPAENAPLSEQLATSPGAA